MNFEKNLKSLEAIIEKMSSGNLSLEDSLKLFEQGTKLSKQCKHDLDQAEKKVQKLIGFSESSGKPITEDFHAKT